MSKFVELEFKNQTLIINSRGGGIAQYYVENNGKRREIMYGYSKQEGCDGGMGDILSPFPGRVDKGEYSYQNKNYKLSGFIENKGNPLHAFVRELEWKVKKTAENQITSTLDVYAKDCKENGYPFSLKYTIIYTLKKNGLDVETVVKNVGENTAPFGIGYHPYFSVTQEVDQAIWQFSAQSVVEFDKSLKPTGRLIPINETRLDFRTPARIGERVIDNCFTDLVRDEKGIFTSRLSNEDGSKSIEIWQDESYPYFQTYSADTIDKKNYRKAMALEPQTCCGYAVNVPGLGLISLKPGEEFRGEWGVNFQVC